MTDEEIKAMKTDKLKITAKTPAERMAKWTKKNERAEKRGVQSTPTRKTGQKSDSLNASWRKKEETGYELSHKMQVGARKSI